MKIILIGLTLLTSISSFAIEKSCEESVNELVEFAVRTGNNSKYAYLQTEILDAPDKELTEAGLNYKNMVKKVISLKKISIKSCDLDVKDIDNLIESSVSTGYIGKHDVLDLAILNASDFELSREGLVYKYAVKNTLALKDAILR